MKSESHWRSLGLRIGARSNGYDKIRSGPGSDVLDAMFFVGMDDPQISGSQGVLRSIYRELHAAFANQPHLGMSMMVRGVRIPIGRQSRLVYLDMLAGSQRAFHDSSHFGVVEGLHGHRVEGEDRRR